MFMFPQNLYVEILTPNDMVSGGGALGQQLGNEGGSLTNGISILLRDRSLLSLSVLHHVKKSKKTAIYKAESAPWLTRYHIFQHLDLGLPRLQNCKK